MTIMTEMVAKLSLRDKENEKSKVIVNDDVPVSKTAPAEEFQEEVLSDPSKEIITISNFHWIMIVL